MSLSVVSDIHIQSPRDNAYVALLDLMKNRLPSDSTLVLAGDIFDFLMGGPPQFSKDYEAFFSAFRDLHLRRITVHYIEGNHDFHLRPFVEKHPNVHLHKRKVNLEFSGKKFHIAHGDLIDKHDIGYRALRMVLRSPFVKVGAEIVPEKFVFKIGEQLSVATKDMRRGDDPRTERTRKLFRNYAVEKFQKGFDFVVLGHSHDYDEDSFRVGDRVGQYMNVGYPKAHKKYVYWDETEGKLVRKPFFG